MINCATETPMPNTLNFKNVPQHTFQRICTEMQRAIPGTPDPTLASDGTYRGHVEHEAEFGGIPGKVAIDYVWSPRDQVLVMDVTKPFFVPWEPIQQNLCQAVDAAKGAALFG